MTQGTSWLDELQAQLKDVEVGEEPDREVEKGEEVVGILPPEDRPLWALQKKFLQVDRPYTCTDQCDQMVVLLRKML
jgi:hypothetical protein